MSDNPGYEFLLTYKYYRDDAIILYRHHLANAAACAAIEDKALAACNGDARAAEQVLLDPESPTPESWFYKSTAAKRDNYLRRAQTAATMATMLLLEERGE